MLFHQFGQEKHRFFVFQLLYGGSFIAGTASFCPVHLIFGDSHLTAALADVGFSVWVADGVMQHKVPEDLIFDIPGFAIQWLAFRRVRSFSDSFITTLP